MTSIYMIIAVLATAASAKGSVECNFPKSSGSHLCFGAVGQQIIFHFSDKANSQFILWKGDNDRILNSDKSGRVTIHPKYTNHSQYINVGTFKLRNATKTHSGNYSLEEFGPNGHLVKKVHLSLEIKAPVSKPAVSQRCLSPEQMQVICSSEGDEAEFMLSLDGQVLIQSREYNQSMKNRTAEISNSTVSIDLHGQMTGKLMCEVWNKVSKEQTVIHLKDCNDFLTNFPVVIVVIVNVITLFFLVALSLVIIKFYKQETSTAAKDNNIEEEIIYTAVKKTRSTTVDDDNVEEEVIYTDVNKARPTSEDDDTSEENQEIVYTDVLVIKHTRKPSNSQENTT